MNLLLGLENCRSKNFKNAVLKIEVAKESFLERLKKERDKRNDKKLSENVSSNFPALDVARKNKKIVFTDDPDCDFIHTESNSSGNVISPASNKSKKKISAVQNSEPDHESDHFDLPSCEIENRKSVTTNFKSDVSRDHSHSPTNRIWKRKSVENSEVGHESDYSEDEVPRKRNLPMFRGTASINESEEPKTDFSMKRFEEFSDVWRDSSPESGTKQNRKLKWKWKESTGDLQVSNAVSSSESNFTNSSLKNAAELKRKNALKEKWNVIKEKKETIRKALKNLVIIFRFIFIHFFVKMKMFNDVHFLTGNKSKKKQFFRIERR